MEIQLRSQRQMPSRPGEFESFVQQQAWNSSQTAIIVCDVWDYHHCLNAVRRIGQFVPRLNEVLKAARKQGVIIIHSPSDCMDAYALNPARQRAIDTPKSNFLPADIESWCSAIPTEENSTYPIDQSDGGEDDDLAEHAQWAMKLESIGRNPKMPWKQQTDLLTIDDTVDYISDRGGEVWNILQERNVTNVILVGVHTNMCVLGRPFGLRRMASGGKNVVLMRDMTDTMYNPKRWPYVSHFEGTRRIITHIERYVCPTISSDQIVGGTEFRFAGDSGKAETNEGSPDPHREWSVVSVPSKSGSLGDGVQWFRCAIRIPASWTDQKVTFEFASASGQQAWINGNELRYADENTLEVPASLLESDDPNLLVVRSENGAFRTAPLLRSGNETLTLVGKWQTRTGDESEFQNIPLPAKFGIGPDIVFGPASQR